MTEFDDAANLLAANPDATTVNIGDPEDGSGKKKGLQSREEEGDFLGNEDSDKTEVKYRKSHGDYIGPCLSS